MKTAMSLCAITLWLSFCASGQHPIPPTDTVKIYGNVVNPVTFSIADIDTFPKTLLQDRIIFNHRGEARDTLTGMQGVSLKTLLTSVQYEYDNPRVLSEFYFVLIASDGYKAVVSWNELNNSEAGDSFFIVTELKGKKLKEMEHRIVCIAAADQKTGRRYIKGLAKIEVKRVE